MRTGELVTDDECRQLICHYCRSNYFCAVPFFCKYGFMQKCCICTCETNHKQQITYRSLIPVVNCCQVGVLILWLKICNNAKQNKFYDDGGRSNNKYVQEFGVPLQFNIVGERISYQVLTPGLGANSGRIAGNSKSIGSGQ